MNIKKWNYMDGYSSSNYGAHSMAIQLGNITLWFSYDTVIAFREEAKKPGGSYDFWARKNVWGPTTGKHLNAISNKEDRLERSEFEAKLQECLQRHNLTIGG